MTRRPSLFLFIATILLTFIGYLSWQIIRVASARASLFNAPARMSIGPADADLKVAEFFSYDCRPCQDLQPALDDALKQDGHVLYIPRALPSESEESVHGAVLAYAAAKQGKFAAFHGALMHNFRVINEAVLDDLVKTAGIDMPKLGQAVNDPDVAAYIRKNKSIYDRLDLQGNPVFLIGRDMVFVPSADTSTADFIKIFAQARAHWKKT